MNAIPVSGPRSLASRDGAGRYGAAISGRSGGLWSDLAGALPSVPLAQEELKSLEQMHSSLRALHQMVASCNETINSLVQNNNTLTDMNKGWQIFFTGQRDLK